MLNTNRENKILFEIIKTFSNIITDLENINESLKELEKYNTVVISVTPAQYNMILKMIDEIQELIRPLEEYFIVDYLPQIEIK